MMPIFMILPSSAEHVLGQVDVIQEALQAEVY